MFQKTFFLAVVLVIVFVVSFGVLFKLYKSNFTQQLSTNSPKPTFQPTGYPEFYSDAPTRAVVEKYYIEYENCLKNPPAESAGKVSEYCQQKSEHISKDFIKNLELGGTSKAGADPVFCTQNPPQKIEVKIFEVLKTHTTQAYVYPKLTFGEKTLEIPVEVKLEGNNWKINNIKCPKP